ncbi:tetratricopeptide repeat protein [Kitasatospora saccharophila]|uniref:tetratricopeptide repeat protein n=1 Tax=Kitasatospora saccharophila TaxID=407973 RepID=UPI00362E6129
MVLGDFLHALGSSDTPDSLDQRAALYRSLLADKRMLILLDNARDAGQLRPLIPGVSGNAVMVTSRSRLAELPGAHLVDIEELTPDEALALFSAIVGAERVGAEPEAALQVVTSCGFLPLAVRIAAARLASRPRWSVSDLARRLADQRNRLQELQLGNLAVETTLGLGYAQLRPEEARAFRLLALVDSPDLPLSAVAALLGAPEQEAEDLAEALVEANMLECFTPGRYRYHDLLRLYAQRQNAKLGDVEQQQAALLRLLDLLHATMHNARQVIEPDDLAIEPLHRADSSGQSFVDDHAARNWLRTEIGVLLGAVEAAADAPLDLLQPTVDILQNLTFVSEDPTLAPRFLTMLRAAAVSPVALRAPETLACVHHALGQIHRTASELAASEESLALSLALQPVDRATVLRLTTANGLAITLTLAGRPAEALSFYQQAQEAARHFDSPISEARLLGNMARAYVGLDRHAEAVEAARAAVAAARASGNVPCLADTLYQLGVVLRATGSPGEAAVHLREAHQLYRQQQHPIWEGYSLARLAACLLADGQFAAAAEAAEESLSIAREIEAAYCQGMANAALGEALLELGQPSRGLACLQEALTVFTRLGVPEARPVQDLIASRHTEPSPPLFPPSRRRLPFPPRYPPGPPGRKPSPGSVGVPAAPRLREHLDASPALRGL